MSLAIPFFEEFLKDLVDEDAQFLRIQRDLVFGVFLQPQHAFREKPERALQIPFERADAVSNRPVWRGRTVKLTGGCVRPRCTEFQPGRSFALDCGRSDGIAREGLMHEYAC